MTGSATDFSDRICGSGSGLLDVVKVGDDRGGSFGTAGMIGIATACLAGTLFVGVTELTVTGAVGWRDSGVVGVVDGASSEGGCVVEGVSGRCCSWGVSSAGFGGVCSPGLGSVFGSITDTVESDQNLGFLRKRRVFIGNGRSGLDSQGT